MNQLHTLMTINWKVVLPIAVVVVIVLVGLAQFGTKAPGPLSQEGPTPTPGVTPTPVPTTTPLAPTPSEGIPPVGTPPPPALTPVPQVAPLPPATGKPDDAVNALVQGVLNEDSLLGAEGAAASSLNPGSNTVGVIGQSFDENAF